MKKIVLMIIISLVSCKEEKKSKNIEVYSAEKQQVVNANYDIFKVTIRLKIKEDDRLDLFYIGESSEAAFNENERQGKQVKGSTEFQTVVFTLPEGVLPYRFRIDLGENAIKNETQVDVEWVRLAFNNNEINIDNSTLNSFFLPNIYLEQNENGYLRKAIANKFDPFITSKPVLNKKMELEF